MQKLPLIVAVGILLSALAQPSTATQEKVSFQAPAQISGSIRIEGNATVIVFPSHEISSSGLVAGPQWSDRFLLRETHFSFEDGLTPSPYERRTHGIPNSQGPGQTTELQFSNAGSRIQGIVLEVRGLELVWKGDGMQAQVLPSGNHCHSWLQTAAEEARGHLPMGTTAGCANENQVLLVYRGMVPQQVTVAGEILQIVARDHNFACHQRPCSTSRPPQASISDNHTILRARASTVEFEHWTFASGRISADLAGHVMFIIAPEMNVVIDGHLRAPSISLPSACDHSQCIRGRTSTLATWGRISLIDLQPDSGGRRLVATWEGQPTAARLDETWIDPALLSTKSQTAIIATGTILAGLLIVKFLLPLITRIRPQDAMAHPRRQRIYGYIVAHPGATMREVMRESGLAAGTARHHLMVLKRSHHIAEHQHEGTLRYFENSGRFDLTWRAEVLLREPDLKCLYEWLEARGPAIQRQILDHADEAWGWSRSTTQHRLARLVAGALVGVTPMGRRKVYRTRPASQPQKVPWPRVDHGPAIPVVPTD